MLNVKTYKEINTNEKGDAFVKRGEEIFPLKIKLNGEYVNAFSLGGEVYPLTEENLKRTLKRGGSSYHNFDEDIEKLKMWGTQALEILQMRRNFIELYSKIRPVKVGDYKVYPYYSVKDTRGIEKYPKGKETLDFIFEKGKMHIVVMNCNEFFKNEGEGAYIPYVLYENGEKFGFISKNLSELIWDGGEGKEILSEITDFCDYDLSFDDVIKEFNIPISRGIIVEGVKKYWSQYETKRYAHLSASNASAYSCKITLNENDGVDVCCPSCGGKIKKIGSSTPKLNIGEEVTCPHCGVHSIVDVDPSLKEKVGKYQLNKTQAYFAGGCGPDDEGDKIIQDNPIGPVFDNLYDCSKFLYEHFGLLANGFIPE